MRVQEFRDGDEPLATLIGSERPTEHGFHVVTPHAGLNVGKNVRPKGYFVPAHWHPTAPRATPTRQEVMHLVSGRIAVTLFSRGGKAGARIELSPGETLVLYSGHRVEYLEESEVFEIKEGPYPGRSADKVYLEPPGDYATY